MEANCNTTITRNPSDYYPSIFEIFTRHFGDVPFFTYQTGITDRYSDTVYDEEDDDAELLPSEGLKLLEQENKEFHHLLEKSPTFKGCKVQQYMYANHENNIFISIHVLLEHNTITMIRVSPTSRRTLTGFFIFSDAISRRGIDELRTYASNYIAPPPVKRDKIHIITMAGMEFSLRDIKLTNKKSQFSYDNYNDGFEDISNRIIETLRTSEESGLVLFHGDPGTGKTSYLKYLLRAVDNKKLIYMPPDLTQHLSEPSFITFMMAEARNSVLLIEDAENVLRHRESGGNQAVSNILNLSDGILGDVLKLQMVCTFNSKLSDIDEALLRPGRCIAEYRFEKLSVDRTVHLMHKIHGEDIEFKHEPMTLAEVFNFKKPKDRTKQRNYGVGFTAQL